MRYNKLINIREESMGNPRMFLSMLLKRKLPSLFFSLKKMDAMYYELSNMYSSFNSKYCVHANGGAIVRLFPSSIMWDTVTKESGFGKARIPKHYEEVLTMLFGDYNSYPPIEDRINEVIRHHRKIKYFSEHYKNKYNEI